MVFRHFTVPFAYAAIMLGAAVAWGQPRVAVSELSDSKGRSVGTVRLEQTPKGVLITGELMQLPPGWHAIHVHETGRCEAPSFESAGEHFNPTGQMHGFRNPNGPHASDLPNVYVSPTGSARFEFLVTGLSLREGPAAMLDGDGAAIVLHERADDHITDPAGASGARIACGAITEVAGRRPNP
jgi:Cu-Zn family superoxide dismutase